MMPALSLSKTCIARADFELGDVIRQHRVEPCVRAGPVATSCPICEISKTPTLFRTAWCSSMMLLYCTGISQPPKELSWLPALRVRRKAGCVFPGVAHRASLNGALRVSICRRHSASSLVLLLVIVIEPDSGDRS